MLKRLLRSMGLIVGLLMTYVVVIFVASESGEVVQLMTKDKTGETLTTRLWVADHDGAMWLRADGSSRWYQRLMQQPASTPATLTRGTEKFFISASVDANATPKLNALMAAKYGLADSLVGGGDPTAVALRVVAVDR
ncbi:MAG: hypothetical protein GWP70_12880 [Proteobacteria bacterium]|nr:hypothetical protein [Pseudomonadota bacterium]